MAAWREDLPSRCLSLLEEVKDFIKKRGVFFVLRPHLHNAFLNVPSKEFSLQNAGLGRKTVVFSSKGSFVDVKEKLEIVYPKLKDGGGFELLRMGSPNAKLALINPSAGGYSMPFLRDAAGLGHCGSLQDWEAPATYGAKKATKILHHRLCLWQGQRRKTVTLCPDSLEFSEPLCSLLCVSMGSFAFSSTLLFFIRICFIMYCDILRIF